MSKKRLLFIPVSSPEGIGEYMRSLQLAQTLKSDYQDALDIHFILNKHTAYAKHCPFTTTLLSQSPTKEVEAVCELIEQYQPDVVLFDCAGRAEQMKAAKKVGAKVVFISQHAKKRAKGLKLNRNKLIDMHWVVQPDYCIAPLTWYEKLKLSYFSLAYPYNVGPFTAFASEQQKLNTLSNYNLKENEFFIVNAGSGGHTVNGVNCADIYFQAGLVIAKQTGLKGVVVFGPNYTKSLPKTNELICLPSQEGTEFLALLSQAKIALLSAGDTLLQAIALQTPTIACAISKDQSVRVARCAATGVVKQAELDILDITQKVQELLTEPNYNNTLSQYMLLENVHSFDVITNGVKVLLQGNKL
ncbi:glycosyltransferase family 1 protein [Pseudoalteromonas tetraodonis]|uniref:glycosyltransferase family 1 protein n=1 Tax=Pseudoalteromonas tetraodonis TaxID=43659 RepID=UPI003CFFA7C3